MRILLMVDHFWPYIGGVEVILAHRLPRLRELGHEISVVTSQDDPGLPEQATFEGVDVHRLPLTAAMKSKDVERLVSVRQRVAKLRREIQPDLLHVVFTGPNIYFARATDAAHPAPTVLSFEGSWAGVRADAKTVLGKMLDSVDWVVGCSQAALDAVEALGPDLSGRSSVIHYGLDPPSLHPASLPFSPPVVLCAGRMTREKGFDLAIEAFVDVLPHVPDARLVMAGEGPERPAIVERAAELGLADSVEFAGWSSPEEIPALLNRATLALVPSRSEGFGLFALESLLMRRPVVAARVGGLPEVLEHGGDALLVPPESPAAMAGAIVRLLTSPEETRRMGDAGRHRARERFPVDRHVEEYDELYRRLAERGEDNGP